MFVIKIEEVIVNPVVEEVEGNFITSFQLLTEHSENKIQAWIGSHKDINHALKFSTKENANQLIETMNQFKPDTYHYKIFEYKTETVLQEV